MLTVIASDSDSGNNGTLLYRLEDVPRHNALPMFAIDPRNGLITTVQTNVLDRELTAEYHLTVVATDRGRPRMSGACICLMCQLAVCRPTHRHRHRQTDRHAHSGETEVNSMNIKSHEAVSGRRKLIPETR